jgi:hypothetical protein
MCKKSSQPNSAQPTIPDPATDPVGFAIHVERRTTSLLLSDILEGAVSGYPYDDWADQAAAAIEGVIRAHPNPQQFLHELRRELLDLAAPHIPPTPPSDLDA